MKKEEELWVTFEQEDHLSLSHLANPEQGEKLITAKNEEEIDDDDDHHLLIPAVADEDFEFQTCGISGPLMKSIEPDMCVADEVFFKGQILPLRPSVSSRTESMDRYVTSSSVPSVVFTTSRSGSSSSSSSGSRSSGGGISRSSSNSHSSMGDGPRLSLSNNFYAHPSPTPQVRHGRKSSCPARKSTGTLPPGLGLLRLGVVKAPEIELFDPRPRPRVIRSNHGDTKQEKRGSNGKMSTSKGDVKEKKVPRFFGFGLGCRCSPDVVDANCNSSGILVNAKKKKEVCERLKRGESTCRSRIFEWLEELSVSKAASME